MGVVVAHDDAALVEQVVEALEPDEDLFVASTSIPSPFPAQVLLVGGEPLAALGQQALPVVALANGDAVRAARAALAAGARDIVRWPEDAARLSQVLRDAAHLETRRAPGRLIGVAGARGGIGTSRLAGLLASALPEAAVATPQPAWESGAGTRVAHVRVRAAEEVSEALRAARSLAPVVVLDCGTARAPQDLEVLSGCDVRLVLADPPSVQAALSLAAAARAARIVLLGRRSRRAARALADAEALALRRLAAKHVAALVRSVEEALR